MTATLTDTNLFLRGKYQSQQIEVYRLIHVHFYGISDIFQRLCNLEINTKSVEFTIFYNTHGIQLTANLN